MAKKTADISKVKHITSSTPCALLALMILLVTAAVYAPSLHNGYTMDDRFVAMAQDGDRPNHLINGLQPLSTYFTVHYRHDTQPTGRLYRPATILSFALVHHFFKPTAGYPADPEQPAAARAQHLANILLHLLATTVAFLLLRGVSLSPLAALLGMLVFGLHAVHSEVVASIVGRAELLAFSAGGLAILVLAASDKEKMGFAKGVGWILAGLLFFAAYSAKEIAAGWLVFLPAYLLVKTWRSPIVTKTSKPALATIAGQMLVAIIPFVLFLTLRHQALAALPAAPPPHYVVNPIALSPPLVRVTTAVSIWIWKGLGLTLFPFYLVSDYGAEVFSPAAGLGAPRFLAALAVLLVLVGLAVAKARQWPLLFLAVVTFFGFSIITANVLLPIGTIFGERLLYAPSFGLALTVAWFYESIGGRPTWLPAFCLAIGIWLGASTLAIGQRNPVWQSNAALFLTDVDRQPKSVHLRVNAATVHLERGEYDMAEHHLQEAVRLDPEYGLAWNNLGAIYLDRGRLDEAEATVMQGLKSSHLDPNTEEELFRLHANFGLIIRVQGKPAAAVEHFAAALFNMPESERAWQELLRTAYSTCGMELVLQKLAEGEEQKPDIPWWSYYRAQVLNAAGKPAAALSAARQAITLAPDHAPSLEMLASLQTNGKITTGGK